MTRRALIIKAAGAAPARWPPRSPRWLDAVLYGIQAFDRWQRGARIDELAARRLRRYLTWHLQRVRGETAESAVHVESLLEPPSPSSSRRCAHPPRSPLRSAGARCDASTEIFAAVSGRLIRHGARLGFDPGALVEAVRRYDAAAVQAAMRFVVAEHRPLLVPWRP
jgi:hypothetical protein